MKNVPFSRTVLEQITTKPTVAGVCFLLRTAVCEENEQVTVSHIIDNPGKGVNVL